MSEKPKSKFFSYITNAFVGLLSLVAPRSAAEPKNDLMNFVKIIDASTGQAPAGVESKSDVMNFVKVIDSSIREPQERSPAESAAADKRIETAYLARKIRETSRAKQPNLLFSEDRQPVPVLNYQADFFAGIVKEPVEVVVETDKPSAEPSEQPLSVPPLGFVSEAVVIAPVKELTFMPLTGELAAEEANKFPELNFVTHEQVEAKPQFVQLPISGLAEVPESAVLTGEPEAVAAGKVTYPLANVAKEVAVEVITNEDEVKPRFPRVGSGQENDVAFAMLYMAVSKLDPNQIIPVLGQEDCRVLSNLWVIISGEEACLLSPTSEIVKALPAIRAKIAEPSINAALGRQTAEVLDDFLAMFEIAKIVTEDPRPAAQERFSTSSVFGLSAVEQASGRVLS